MMAALLAFVLWYQLFDYQRQKYQGDARLASADYGNLLRTEVDRELNSLLFISNGLSSYLKVYHRALDPGKLKAILADLWAKAEHVRNLGVAVNYTLTYVYPETNNQKIIGLDFRTVPAQWPKVKLAIDTRQGVLDGPIQLIQGGSGIVYRYPIFIDDRYWGIMSTVIDTDAFLAAAFQATVRDDYVFAIRIADNGHVFYGDPALFAQKDTYRQESLVPNGKWEWAIKSKRSHVVHGKAYVWGMSGFLSLLVGALAYFFTRERYYLSEGALMDSLTGLPNRRLLEDRLNYAHSEAKRFGKRFGLMALDIDHFKQINDSYGHDVGDEVIKCVAQTIKSSLRDVDTVSRIGGDEFVILVKEVHAGANLSRVATKLLAMFEQPLLIAGHDMTVQLSIGLTVFEPQAEVTLKQLHKQADLALYQAKQAGRNTWRFYDNTLQKHR